jgi:SAM-dependent methyltransferase
MLASEEARIGGTMTDAGLEHQSYDPRFFGRIAEIEDRNFWFCARNRIIAAAVRRVIAGLPTGFRVLEVGCGTGVVLRQLTKLCRDGEVIGMDLYSQAAVFASGRAACRVIVGDILNPPSLGEFDVVGIFDVLEHLTNDRQILSGLNRMIKPGGALILTVPAHMALWSYFDVAACHCRRYASTELAHILRETGFEVEYLTEFMMSLFPLLWLVRRIKGGSGMMDRERAAKKAANELTIVPILNGILKLILSVEALVIERRWRLPVGTSLLAVARKK